MANTMPPVVAYSVTVVPVSSWVLLLVYWLDVAPAPADRSCMAEGVTGAAEGLVVLEELAGTAKGCPRTANAPDAVHNRPEVISQARATERQTCAAHGSG
jgi:hypothetical protein